LLRPVFLRAPLLDLSMPKSSSPPPSHLHIAPSVRMTSHSPRLRAIYTFPRKKVHPVKHVVQKGDRENLACNRPPFFCLSPFSTVSGPFKVSSWAQSLERVRVLLLAHLTESEYVSNLSIYRCFPCRFPPEHFNSYRSP